MAPAFQALIKEASVSRSISFPFVHVMNLLVAGTFFFCWELVDQRSVMVVPCLVLVVLGSINGRILVSDLVELTRTSCYKRVIHVSLHNTYP